MVCVYFSICHSFDIFSSFSFLFLFHSLSLSPDLLSICVFIFWYQHRLTLLPMLQLSVWQITQYLCFRYKNFRIEIYDQEVFQNDWIIHIDDKTVQNCVWQLYCCYILKFYFYTENLKQFWSHLMNQRFNHTFHCRCLYYFFSYWYFPSNQYLIIIKKVCSKNCNDFHWSAGWDDKKKVAICNIKKSHFNKMKTNAWRRKIKN